MPQRRQFESREQGATAFTGPAPQTPFGMLWAALTFLLAYTVVGFAGIALQSAQTGVTPVWPASGIAFGICYWFGIRYAVLIIPAMLGLAWVLGVPLSVALLAGLGSALEAGIAVWLLRRFKADPSLMELRDTLLFIGLAAVVGPLFSAALGSLAMALLTENPIPPIYIGMMWWLGNSLGVLLVGGLLLVIPGRRSFPRDGRQWVELAALGALALVVTWFGIRWVEQVSSALVLYLLVPALVIAALRIGQFGVLLLGSLVLVMLLVASGLLPHGSLGEQELGILYLDITLLWVASFTGLIVGSARQEREQREEVSWLATHDSLTGLVNRDEFLLQLDRVLRLAREQQSHHAIVYIDLDRFRRLNDTEGHAAGDRVLRDVAAMLVAEVRRRDAVARIGGDEFALLLESCPLVEACGIAENARRSLEAYSYHGVHADYAVEASIGVVEVSADSVDSGTVLDQADAACIEAKRAGHNRVWVGLSEGDTD